MTKDTVLYDRLGVTPDSCEEDISKAFKNLARKFHPDKHTPENKEEMTVKFQEILQAKEILLDKEKRNIYDQVGMDMLKNNMEQHQQPDIHSFFQHFQSQFQGFSSNEPREDIVTKIEVTLKQLYNEETINVNYKYNCSCVKCNGEGTKNGKPCTCPTCNGKGVVIQIIRMGPMVQHAQAPCNHCRGKGKIVEQSNVCDGCNGKTFTIKDKTIQVPLKSKLTSGSKIHLANKGHQLKTMRTDLYIVIVELPHPYFKRANDDLITTVELKLYQALFGFDKVIEHLDGHKVYISSSSKMEYNKICKVAGKGMKSGDLYIRFLINIPNLSLLPNEIKLQYKTLFQSFDKNEAQLEASVVKEKLPSSQLIECREKESNTVRNIINQESTPQPEEESREYGDPRAQCQHQ
jgi:DnaJ-class molecular chaperone